MKTFTVRRVSKGNLGIAWRVTFPDGKRFHAETREAAEAYGRDNIGKHQAAPIEQAVTPRFVKPAAPMTDQEAEPCAGASRAGVGAPQRTGNMKRPGYREAIDWLAANDDCEWLFDEHGSLSVSASLVADLFDVGDEKVTKDLRKAYAKLFPQRETRT